MQNSPQHHLPYKISLCSWKSSSALSRPGLNYQFSHIFSDLDMDRSSVSFHVHSQAPRTVTVSTHWDTQTHSSDPKPVCIHSFVYIKAITWGNCTPRTLRSQANASLSINFFLKKVLCEGISLLKNKIYLFQLKVIPLQALEQCYSGELAYSMDIWKDANLLCNVI